VIGLSLLLPEGVVKTDDDVGRDNNWPDNLNLVDVIEKHLERHLHEAFGENET
jgi:hypothetical protein